jgi:iron complex transport system substrate-binding protein
MFRQLYRKLCELKIDIRRNLIYKQLFLSFLMAVSIAACDSEAWYSKSSDRSSISETLPPTNCRTIDHVAGETCVPSSPQRLVALSVPTMADALAVGVKPVGTILYFDEPPPYLKGKLDGIEPVGTNNQPNLEKILTLNPDLIIGFQYVAESVYGQLSQIAPTVLDDWKGYPSWKDHFNFVAEVLGKTEEAERVWAHYDRRIQELRAALDDSDRDTEVSIVRVCCGNLATDVKNSFIGTILNDVGFSRPPAQDIEVENGLVFLSEELIADMNGDIIFVIVDKDEDSQKVFEQLQQKPLWNQLKAVQQGQVYPVNLPTWRGGNPLAADAVIDDLFEYLVEKQENS